MTTNKPTTSPTSSLNNNVITLGCRLNSFESAIIKQQLKNSQIEDTIVINTCCVTQKAEEQSINRIKKIKKLYPHKNIVVTGCAVHTALERLQNMEEVSQILDNHNKFNLTHLKNPRSNPETHENAISNYQIPQLNVFTNQTRAFVQIQQGCDHRCSFCIIHKARGKSISLSEKDIITQINTIVNNGHKEVVLTGVDISSWQRNALNNEPSKLGQLCQSILQQVPNLMRLRLSSLDPSVRDDTILQLLQTEHRFMPHLHLSLQSMSPPVLNNMGRRHSKASASIWIKDLKSVNPNLVLGADIICGFPKETEEQFIETATTLQELNIPLLHVFPYSERRDTPAAKMPQIPQYQRKKRALTLIAIAEQLKTNLFKAKLNQTEEILVESNNSGYTKDYCLVKIVGNTIAKNTICLVTIIGYDNKHLIAKPLTN